MNILEIRHGSSVPIYKPDIPKPRERDPTNRFPIPDEPPLLLPKSAIPPHVKDISNTKVRGIRKGFYKPQPWHLPPLEPEDKKYLTDRRRVKALVEAERDKVEKLQSKEEGWFPYINDDDSLAKACLTREQTFKDGPLKNGWRGSANVFLEKQQLKDEFAEYTLMVRQEEAAKNRHRARRYHETMEEDDDYTKDFDPRAIAILSYVKEKFTNTMDIQYRSRGINKKRAKGRVGEFSEKSWRGIKKNVLEWMKYPQPTECVMTQTAIQESKVVLQQLKRRLKYHVNTFSGEHKSMSYDLKDEDPTCDSDSSESSSSDEEDRPSPLEKEKKLSLMSNMDDRNSFLNDQLLKKNIRVIFEENQYTEKMKKTIVKPKTTQHMDDFDRRRSDGFINKKSNYNQLSDSPEVDLSPLDVKKKVIVCNFAGISRVLEEMGLGGKTAKEKRAIRRYVKQFVQPVNFKFFFNEVVIHARRKLLLERRAEYENLFEQHVAVKHSNTKRLYYPEEHVIKEKNMLRLDPGLKKKEDAKDKKNFFRQGITTKAEDTDDCFSIRRYELCDVCIKRLAWPPNSVMTEVELLFDQLWVGCDPYFLQEESHNDNKNWDEFDDIRAINQYRPNMTLQDFQKMNNTWVEINFKTFEFFNESITEWCNYQKFTIVREISERHNLCQEIRIAHEWELISLEKIYNEFDLDDSGTLSVEEVSFMIRELNIISDQTTMDAFLEHLDHLTRFEHKKEMGFSDFLSLLSWLRDFALDHNWEMMMTKFRNNGIDFFGRLNQKEIWKMLDSLEVLPKDLEGKAQVEELVHYISNHEGTVTSEEFGYLYLRINENCQRQAFSKMYAEATNMGYSIDSLISHRENFRRLQNEQNVMSLESVSQLFVSSGVRIAPKKLCELFNKFDVDQSGAIEFIEYLALDRSIRSREITTSQQAHLFVEKLLGLDEVQARCLGSYFQLVKEMLKKRPITYMGYLDLLCDLLKLEQLDANFYATLRTNDFYEICLISAHISSTLYEKLNCAHVHIQHAHVIFLSKVEFNKEIDNYWKIKNEEKEKEKKKTTEESSKNAEVHVARQISGPRPCKSVIVGNIGEIDWAEYEDND